MSRRRTWTFQNNTKHTISYTYSHYQTLHTICSYMYCTLIQWTAWYIRLCRHHCKHRDNTLLLHITAAAVSLDSKDLTCSILIMWGHCIESSGFSFNQLLLYLFFTITYINSSFFFSAPNFCSNSSSLISNIGVWVCNIIHRSPFNFAPIYMCLGLTIWDWITYWGTY